MARKIEQQVTDAVRARRAFCGGNTTVTPTADGGLTVMLHGNLIAAMNGSRLSVGWCGWHTPTTSSRLNCVLDALAPGYYACIRNRTGRIMRRADHSEVENISALQVAS